MALVALAVFLMVAVFGALMVAGIARHKTYPGHWPMAHAAAGAVGLVLLYLGLLDADYGTMGWVALAILAAALAGGGFLFGIVYRGRQRPLVIALMHGSLGLTGVAVLAYVLLVA